MHACVCLGRLGEAEALLEPLRERSGAVSRPVVSGHNLLMKAHAQAANPDAARKLFAAMKARGLVPDAVTYNTLLGVFVAAGEVLRAKAVLHKMQREGVVPDGWSYTTLLLGLGQAGQLAEARQVLAAMTAAGLAPNEVRAALRHRAQSDAAGMACSCCGACAVGVDLLIVCCLRSTQYLQPV
jgi:pentatricopeptide repeat protein